MFLYIYTLCVCLIHVVVYLISPSRREELGADRQKKELRVSACVQKVKEFL